MVILAVVGCGKPVQIAQPADGQVFSSTAPQAFYVTLSDNDYNGASFEFIGMERLQGIMSCQAGSGTFAACYPAQSGGYGGGMGMGGCTEQVPCVVTIVVTRNGVKDVRKIVFKPVQAGK